MILGVLKVLLFCGVALFFIVVTLITYIAWHDHKKKADYNEIKKPKVFKRDGGK